MNKIKSISRFVTTYDRATTYDDTIEEIKRMLSCMEYDEFGNLCCDKTYNTDGECENKCKRVYNEQRRVVEEMFFDGMDDVSYESRKNIYDDNGFLIESQVTYSEEVVIEQYNYNEQGKLLEKKVVYPDGGAYVENKYVWEKDLLLDEYDFEDEDTISIRKKYRYDDQGRLVELEIHEITQNNRLSEKYEYDDLELTKQTTYNFKGDIMATRTFAYDAEGLMIERIVETPSQYLKYTYEYNEEKLLIKECMLNKDDILLTMREIKYNAENEEIQIDVFSRNLVEHIDELIPIETHTTTYEYF